MKILHWRHTPELAVIIGFLKWQQPRGALTVEDHPRCLKESNMTNVPVIYDAHGKQIARGFQELLKVWDKEGWWLC